MNYFDHEYHNHNASVRFNIRTIESHQKVNDLVFTHKILHGLINCPQLNKKFVFRNVPYPIRDSRTLLEHCSRSDYNFYSLINRCKRQWNTIPPEVQICTNPTSFKNSQIIIPKILLNIIYLITCKNI